MLFPIADDNRERRTTPVVNYVIILINIFVFVFLQGLGSNEKFTYAYSTVPGEIITGRDIVTRPVAVQNFTGQRMELPGLQPTPMPAFVAIGLWFVFQLISGLGMLGSGSQAGGVAYAAHIGGFIAGLILIKIFEIGRRPPDRYYEREF